MEERFGADTIWRTIFLRHIPFGVNILYTLGFASAALFLVQAVTGAVLAMYYSPSPDHAYDSVQYIMTDVTFGQVIRSIHNAGASAMVVVVVLHALVVFGMAAYKRPREVTWVVGVILLVLTLAFGFTGYLLPWDEKAYWATTVGTNIAGTIPLIGGVIVRILRGGPELGALTLTRFYASHVLLLPMALATVIGVHMFLVIRLGVSVPPALWDRAMQEASRARGAMATSYQEIYQRFKDRGVPFFPDVIFEDAVASVTVILIVIAVAVVVGGPLESQADPTNTAYVPRPEWYFMFLFQMLKYFPGAIEWVGAVLLPGLFVIILLLLPFFDRRPTRAPRSRPVALAIAAVVVLAIVFLTIQAYQTTPPPAPVTTQRAQNLNDTQLAGKKLVQAQGCANCHVIAGQGGNVGPKLDGVSSRRDAAYIYAYISNPKDINPSASMPRFSPPLRPEEVQDITQYLLTLQQ